MRSAFVHAKMIAVPVEHFMGNPKQPDCLYSIGMLCAIGADKT
jgi:hypothetical protein